MKAESFIPSQDNTTLTVKFSEPSCVLEFKTEAVHGVHPFQVSNLSVAQYDELESYPIDGMFMSVAENNKVAFTSIFSNL